MFVARNPGRKEHALQSQPLEPTARCGNLFEKNLNRIGLTRDKVWVTNLVLGYTLNDRPPTQQEISNCLPYLLRQIEVVKPRVIVTLGVDSSRALLGPLYTWKRDHGHPAGAKLMLNGVQLTPTIIPITHPGQAIRGVYHEFIDDFDVIKQMIT